MEQFFHFLLLRQIIQEAQSFTRANLFSERIVNAWKFLPDTVDFSFISGFKRSIHKVDFSKSLKCFKVAFMVCTLCFVQLLYSVYLCVTVFFYQWPP